MAANVFPRFASSPLSRFVGCPVCNKRISLIRKCDLKNSIRHGSSSNGQSAIRKNPLVRYWQSLKWVPLPVGVGVAYLCYQQYGHSVIREQRKIQDTVNPEDLLASPFQVSLYRKLPLKTLSRLWGKLHHLELPMWLRKPALGLYIWMFDCNIEEAAVEDLQHYKNLNEFFRRSLKPYVRSVDENSLLVSPSDGKILHFGKVENGKLEQVKGITYSLQGFMGPQTDHGKTDSTNTSVSEASLLNNDNTNLYHCVIYLAPGDYHRFHSPTNWSIKTRRHFPGDLLSVNPGIAHWVEGLFNFNERAVYSGNWQFGFFSMTAVGATSVGSIKVYFDKDLETNCGCKWPEGTHFDYSFTYLPTTTATHTSTNLPVTKTVSDEKRQGIQLNQGAYFGEFNLGSTIVLIFEGPKNFKFTVQSGQKIKYGQSLGLLS